MYAPCPGRSLALARQENLFFGKITAGLFIHWMIKKKLENFPGKRCSLPEQSIPKPAFFTSTKSNPPGFSTPLHELTSARVSANSVSLHHRARCPTLSFFEGLPAVAGGSGNVESQKSQHRRAPPTSSDATRTISGKPPLSFDIREPSQSLHLL